jgi:hypothetical protein
MVAVARQLSGSHEPTDNGRNAPLQKLLNKPSTHRKPGAKQSSNIGVDSIRITPKLS